MFFWENCEALNQGPECHVSVKAQAFEGVKGKGTPLCFTLGKNVRFKQSCKRRKK